MTSSSKVSVFGNDKVSLADLPNSHSAAGQNLSSTSVRSHISKPTKNKSQNDGVFSGDRERGAKTPHSPRITPRFHHRKTTSKHTVFPKPPSKTSANQQLLTTHHNQKRIPKKISQLPEIYLVEFQESDLRAASRTIPISASPWAVEMKAASNWLGGSQTPASSMAR
jgi:hypothetical protein